MSDFATLQRQFAINIRKPGQQQSIDNVDSARMQVYQQIIAYGFKDLLERHFPVLKAMIGEGRWQQLLTNFLADGHSHSPIYRQLSQDFVAYLQQIEVPRLWQQLAHYEALEVVIDVMADVVLPAGLNNSSNLEQGRVVVSPYLSLQQYDYPVHQASAEYTPAASTTYLAVYRNRTHQVKFIELNNFSARLLQLLIEQPQTLVQAVSQLAKEAGQTDVELLRPFALGLLQQLQSLDIVLGTTEVMEDQSCSQ